MASIDELQKLKQDVFQKRREQAVQQANVGGQKAQDVLTRRFAAMGGVGSGAEIQSKLRAKQEAEQGKQQALQGIGEQELQSQQQDLAMKMQQDESQKGREFAASEAEKGRQAAMAEAEKGRMFQEKMADKDMAQKREIFEFERTAKLREMDLAQQQFELDKATTEFNKRMAELSSSQPTTQGGITGQVESTPIAGEIVSDTRKNPIGSTLTQTAVGYLPSISRPVKDIKKEVKKRFGISL